MYTNSQAQKTTCRDCSPYKYLFRAGIQPASVAQPPHQLCRQIGLIRCLKKYFSHQILILTHKSYMLLTDNPPSLYHDKMPGTPV